MNKKELARIYSSAIRHSRNYMEKEGFNEILTPYITKASGSCENPDNLFILDYFGNNAFLSQTGQLYLESLVYELEKVYSIGPSFRAEGKDDKRHLTQFTLVEFEFLDRFEGLLNFIENIVYNTVENVCTENNIDAKIEKPFERIPYKEAIRFLGLHFGTDLNHQNEIEISKYVGNKPVFILHYPKELKFFNMIRNCNDRNIVNSADLILPYSGESAGAAEREYRSDAIKRRLENSDMFKKMIKKGVKLDDFKWYLDSTKDAKPHSGCGIGLERVIQFILKTDDIRNATVFPTTINTIW